MESRANGLKRTNPYIDYDYLIAGADQALKLELRTRDHPVDADEIAAFSAAQYEWAGRHMFRRLAQVMECRLFVNGVHNLRIDWKNRRFIPIESTKRIPRPMVNLIIDKAEGGAGSLSKGVLQGKVVPNSEKYRDILGARAADKINGYTWAQDRMDRKIRDMIWQMVTDGDAYTYTEITGSVEQEVEIQLPDGTTMKVMLGDVTTTVLNSMQIFFNDGATEVNGPSHYWTHIHVLQDSDFVKEQFPEIRADIKSDANLSNLSSWQKKLEQLATHDASSTGYSGKSLVAGGSGDRLRTDVVAHTILCRPSRLYPKGRKFIVAGGAVCYAGPINEEEITLTQCRYSPIPGCPYSRGMVQDLISPTKHLESVMGQNNMARKITATPYWLTPYGAKGSFVNAEIDLEPGINLRFHPGRSGERPEMVMGKYPGDGNYQADLDWTKNGVIEPVSGRRQILEGERPDNVSSGVALRTLSQQANVRFAAKQEEIDDTIEDCVGFRLRCIAKSPAWALPRKVGLPGRTGRYSYRLLQAADMHDNYTYRIIRTGKEVSDDVVKSQTALDMWQFEVVNRADPRNQQVILDLVGLGDAGFVTGPSRDIENAQLMISMIEDGLPYQIEDFSDFATQFKVVREYMLTEDFVFADTDVKERIREYANELRQRQLVMGIGRMNREASMDEAAAGIASATDQQVPPELAGGPPMQLDMGGGGGGASGPGALGPAGPRRPSPPGTGAPPPGRSRPSPMGGAPAG